MPIIQTKDLKVGMMVSEDTFSKAGQLIVRKDSILNRQMISHLKFYSITQINIYEDALSKDILNAIENRNGVQTTQLERILQSEEYKVFKKDYSANVNMLEDNVNDIILRNTPIDSTELVNETVKIFDKNQDYFSFFGMLHSMKQIDDSTFAHSVNVAMIARLIGTWSGFDKETLDLLTLAGLLHDVGKCQIPDEILMTPRKLTNEEYQFVKMHALFGYEILKNQDLDMRIKQAALHHHERCDGTGYPFGHDIKKLGDFECIISIADVYDAMTADRCYRSGLCPFEVISFFEEEGLQKYHPKYITSFLQRIANSYLNCDVLLSNGDTARIIFLNERLTRPIVQLNKNKAFLNLEQNPHIYIQAII
ncbi:MAG: HD domain-containing protein [Agathobacter sp.]|nr:HD domain-containing protein [Agathobacter sp.]